VCVCSGCREWSVDGRSRVRRGVSTSPSLSARWSCSCTSARHVNQLAACTRPSHPTRPGDASLVLVARLRTPGQQVVTCTCQWRRQNFVTGGGEVRVYRGSRVRSPPVPVVLSVHQRGSLLDALPPPPGGATGTCTVQRRESVAYSHSGTTSR